MYLNKIFRFVVVLAFFNQNLLVFALKDKRIKELQKIVNDKNITKIERILKKNIDDERKCLLFYSVSTSNRDVLFYLIENGIDVNTFDEEYNTPLIIACSSNNNEDIVDFLLKKGASVNPKNSKLETPLIAASKIPNNYKTIKLLLNAGANIDAPITKDGKTALMFFAEKDNIFGLNSLIENGAEINLQDNEGKTALNYAFYHNSAEAAKILLERKAIIKLDDTGLLIKKTLDTRDQKLISLLVNSGVNPNAEIEIEENKKVSLLEYTIVYLQSFEIAEVLVKAGANVNKTVCSQEMEHTLLYYVTDINPNEKIEELIKNYGGKLSKQEELEINKRKTIAEQERKLELEKKRITYENFCKQVIYHNGIPLEIGDDFSIPRNRLEVIDRMVGLNGYTYLVTYWTSSAQSSIDYALSFSGGGRKFCFYIDSKKELRLEKIGLYPMANGSVISNVNPLKIICSGIGQYESNFQSVDCYVFALIEEETQFYKR